MERPSRKTLINYFRGECPPDERELVELYLAMDPDAKYLEDCLREAWPFMLSDTKMSVIDSDLENFKRRFHLSKTASAASADQGFNQDYKVVESTQPDLQENISLYPKANRFIKFQRLFKVAAAIILVAGSSVLLWRTFGLATSKEQLVKQAVKIGPGQDKALLALADGKVIKLADIAVGATLELQNGIKVEKKSDGDIVYHTGDAERASRLAYNTVITPNGGQFRVTLPDGSKAWLNAGSSLRYPLRFAAHERKVKMTGEVYFEIAKLNFSSSTGKRGRVPFYVEANKQQVEVLGTHFNINAYTDEPHVVTTLTEGNVQVRSNNGRSVLLAPGEQALVAEDISVRKVDVAAYLAWTNGDFAFKGEPLQSVLRKLARWYDIEAECASELAGLRFSGMISRSQPLSTIIDMLETTKKVKVTLTGRRLTVRN